MGAFTLWAITLINNWSVSILVFLEWALSLWNALGNDNNTSLFQSLFSWNGRFHSYFREFNRNNFCVSILVFLEWALSPYNAKSYVQNLWGFQSLFSWNGRFHLQYPFFAFTNAKFQSLFSWNGRFHTMIDELQIYQEMVSILVFLEWALSLAISILRLHQRKVSILVFLEWALSLHFLNIFFVLIGKFQSLFSWNGRFHEIEHISDVVNAEVSILVFLEWALSRNCRIIGQIGGDAFQSLFSWNGRFHACWLRNWVRSMPCFNPCFLGMGAFTHLGLEDEAMAAYVSILVFLEWALSHYIWHWNKPSHAEFQSLFSWNGRFHNPFVQIDRRLIEEFQSLFSWNGRFHSFCWAVEISRSICFNPCFLGMGAFTGNWEFRFAWWANVSILVFLEWALSLAQIANIANAMIVFQSLFSWNGRFHRSQVRVLLGPQKVSILVFLEWALSLKKKWQKKILWCWFQSLFSWNGRFHRSQVRVLLGPQKVSILVFLEWALSPWKNKKIMN